MSNIKPTRAQMFNGLRKRPTYGEISQEINPDKTKVIYPNRDAKKIKMVNYFSQLCKFEGRMPKSCLSYYWILHQKNCQSNEVLKCL